MDQIQIIKTLEAWREEHRKEAIQLWSQGRHENGNYCKGKEVALTEVINLLRDIEKYKIPYMF